MSDDFAELHVKVRHRNRPPKPYKWEIYRGNDPICIKRAMHGYIGGSLGTLIGADLLNLGSIRGLGAPVASIGGAGTFDGIFLIGIVAVLIASLSQSWSRH